MTVPRIAARWVLALGMVWPASLEAQDPTPPDLLRDGFYVGMAGGWAVPAGSIDGITDVIRFDPSVDASAVYDNGLVIGVFTGRRMGAWIAGIDIDMRLSPVTDEGQALVNLVGPFPDRDVGVEYATFEAFAGRQLTLGGATVPRTSLFGGVGIGLALLQLSQGTGVEPLNQEGLSASAKMGLDHRLGESSPIVIRVSGRYQLVGVGVDIPRDMIAQVGVSYGFIGG